MHPHHQAAFWVRLLACGPLLYLGLMMVNDPDGIQHALAGLADLARSFGAPIQFRAARDVRYLIRTGGIAFVICALLPLTGLVN